MHVCVYIIYMCVCVYLYIYKTQQLQKKGKKKRSSRSRNVLLTFVEEIVNSIKKSQYLTVEKIA